MASVDGSRFYLASSDETFQHTCGPCKDDGETKEANYLCEICKTYLCFHCRKDHKTFKATKNHSIVSAHLSQGALSTKGAFAILCGCDQKRAVEVYCEKHAEVICPTCEAIKHRNCKTCPITDKITKDAKKQLKKVIDKAKALKVEIKTLKKDGEASCKKLDAKTEECKKEITTFRREINKIMDKVEEEILVTLGKRSNQQLQVIERQIATLTASLQALDTDLNVMDNANKTNNDTIMFSANVKLSKSISEYNELTKDIRNRMQSPNLKFQENKKLIDMLKSVEGFGRIEVVEADSTQQMLLDMKVKSTKEVSITLSDDSTTPHITGCTFLSNGRILLCDYQNQKVKLLDSDMSVKKSLKLSYIPYNVAAVGENEAIITFGSGNNDLQYIITHPELKLCKKITLPNKCYGLQVVNDAIYTACHKGSGHDEIWRLDRAGNIMSKIVLPQSSSGWSFYLGLCLTGSSPRVYLPSYLTDSSNSRVSCFQLDGKMVYQYQDKELKWPNGIYVDSEGNSLVCGWKSHNVVVITADGRKHGELLTSKDIRNPRCIDYRPEDNTLIVGCVDSSKLFVFKLGK